MRRKGESRRQDYAAGNGLLNRRVFLEGALLAGAAGSTAASAEPLAVPSWMTQPGAAFVGYGQPSRFERKVARMIVASPNPATVGLGAIRTPPHMLNGMITPNGLPPDPSHAAAPAIEPDR